MLLLLDIDGVMVQAAPWKRVESLDDGFYKFMPKAVSSLIEIISETGASIIITSSHKSKYSLNEWQKIFKKRGIDASVNKLEDNTEFLSRKDEILRWVSKNANLNEFVIIDDDKSLHDLPKRIKDRVVFTQPLIGLKKDDVFSAINILKRPALA